MTPEPGTHVAVIVYDVSTLVGRIASAAIEAVAGGWVQLVVEGRPERWSLDKLAERHGLALNADLQDRLARARAAR